MSGGSRYTGSSNYWAFTLSGSAGLLIKLGTSADLDLGYRYIHAGSGKYSLAGVSFQGEAAKAHVLYSGLNLHF